MLVLNLDSHSFKCLKVKAEVLKAEENPFNFEVINYKLNKLRDHIIYIKKNNEDIANNNILSKNTLASKDIPYISSLIIYIKEVIDIQKIEVESLKKLKKSIINLDVYNK